MVEERVNFPAHSAREIQELFASPDGLTARGQALIGRYAQALKARHRTSHNKTLVVVWNEPIFGVHWEAKKPVWVKPCDIPCEWTRDRDRLGEADAVAISLDFPLPVPLPARRPGLAFVAASMENLQRRGEFHTLGPRLGRADLLITYELDAHVPRPYLEPPFLKRRDRSPVKRGDAAIAAFISNCNTQAAGDLDRLHILRQLARLVPVHHYGRCDHNTNMEATGNRRRDWGARKLEVAASYRFLAAMENSLALDYVSEKVYHALAVGTVPVYLGAPNIYDFLPCNRTKPCIVHVAAFVEANGRVNTVRLARHLQHLAANETAYGEYLAWRHEPWPPRFKALASFNRLAASCRVCHCLQGDHGCSAGHT